MATPERRRADCLRQRMSPPRLDALPPAPIEPMLAKVAEALPAEGDFLFEPKWDGFRALVFRRARREIAIQSRDLRAFDRYFPELHAALAERLPAGLRRRRRDRRRRRRRPRLRRPAAAAAPGGVARRQAGAGDAGVVRRLRPPGRGRPVADGGRQAERRAALERLLAGAKPPLHLTPATRDRAVAAGWLREFEGAGLDGVIAKPLAAAYQPGKRAMLKIKHQRTADCVVAGLRWHKSTTEGGPEAVGSLLLGLFDDAGRLHHVGITASFTMARRRELAQELAPLRRNARAGHPVGRLGRRRSGRRRDGAAPARRRQPLERRQGPVLGAAPAGAGLRGARTTTSRAIASATPPPSFAGGPTSRPGTAATTSSRWCRLTP